MDAVISNNQYLSVKAAALEINMSTDWVIKSLIYPGKVVAVKFGERWRIDLKSWNAYIAALKQAA